MRKPEAEPLSVTNNAISLLQVRNLSLANKVTFLRRHISEISSHQTEYEKKNTALSTNLEIFQQHWIKYVNELKVLRELQRPFNDQKLEQEFDECLNSVQVGLDSLTFIQPQEEFQDKIAAMFSGLHKFHQDIVSESQQDVKTVIEKLTMDIEQNIVPKESGFDSLSALQQKLQEFSESMETIRGANNIIQQDTVTTEIENLKKEVEKLEEELADVKEYNECLNRRNKVLMKGFALVDEDLEKEIELGCICGGKLYDYLIIENIKVNKEVDEDEMNEERKFDGSEITNKDVIALNQKAEKLEKDLEEALEQKLEVIVQNERLKQEKKNMEETFFNSNVYNSLVGQSQELLKYINLLKSKIGQYEKLFRDFEKTRTSELEEVFKKVAEDKDKFLGLIKEVSMSYEDEKKKFEHLEFELVKDYDLSVKFNSVLQIMEGNDKKYTTLNQENEVLRNQLKEYNSDLQVANARGTELNDKVLALTHENQRLRLLIPGEIKLENLPFRHSKHREFLNELHNINKTHNLNIKEKVDDLKVYIKSREEKVEHMEAKMKKLNEEISQNKKHADGLIKEFELNSKIAADVDQKYQQLNSQIRSQNENFANLVKEKVNNKNLFEQEKAIMQSKMRANDELVDKLQNHINDLNAKIQAQLNAQETAEELILAQKAYVEDNKMIRDDLLKKIEEMKKEASLTRDTYNLLEQSNKELLKDNESLKKQLKEKNGIISQKLQRLKRMSNDANPADDEETEFLKLENEKFKKMILCSVCGLKEKSVVLGQCFHTFCKECIKGTMEARNRRCPVCKTKIGIGDIKPLHWDV